MTAARRVAPRLIGSAPSRRPRSGLRAAFHDDARQDEVPTLVADLVAFIPIVGTVLLALLYLVHRPAYYGVLREDMPVEWLQFAGLLFTAALAALTARRAVGSGRVLVFGLVLLAVGAFVLAGEEISWGQRVFAFGTPEQLAGVNMQAETNVHNVEVAGLPLQSVFKLVSFLLALGGLILAWLTRPARPRLSGRFWRAVAVPSYTMIGSALMVVFWVLVVIAPSSPLMRFQEWAEASLYLALGAAVFAISRRPGIASEADPATAAAHRRSVGDPPAFAILAAIAVGTIVFAALTAYHGIAPLNNPEVIGP